MINYIAFTGNPANVKKMYSMAENVLLENITFKPLAVAKKISANAKWAYIVYADDKKELDQRVVSDLRGFFLINGPALRFKDNLDVASAAMDASVSANPDLIFESISGSFNCTFINSRNGLISFPDFSGTYPIYHRKIDDVVFVSNRATALAKLEPETGFEFSSLSWLIGHSNIFSENTPYDDVYQIKPGEYLKTKIGQSDISLIKFNNQIWPIEEKDYVLDDLTNEEWDDIVDELLKNIKAAASRIDGNLQISLTGGKDSRLTLALALGAGLKDSIITFTSGPEGSPEIACAASLAKLAGVQHQPKILKKSQENQDFESTWKKLRLHNFRYESFICPWDGAGAGIVNRRSIDITGFGGELYRGPGGHAKQFKNLSFLKETELINFWINYHQRMDPHNILRESYKDYQISWMKNWLHANEGVVRKDVLPEKFFVENRLSNWNGPLAQNVIGRTTLMPLLSQNIAKKILRLNPTSRTMEYFHFTVMAKAFPDLVSHPFLNASWDLQLNGRMGLFFSTDPWDGKKSLPRSIQAWQFEFLENEKNNIIDLLDFSYHKTDIDKIFDVRKVINWLKENDNYKTVVDAKVIMSAIALAHTLTGKSDVVKDNFF